MDVKILDLVGTKQHGDFPKRFGKWVGHIVLGEDDNGSIESSS